MFINEENVVSSRDLSDFSGRLPAIWISNPPSNEKEIEEYFDSIAIPRFKLYNQIWLRHSNGQRFKIDRVAFDRSGEIQGPIGFEFKDTGVITGEFGDFSKAVAQSIDYAHCRIESDLVPASDWFGKNLRYVFVFPCPYSVYELQNNPQTGQRDLWTQGALKLSGKYGVGAVAWVEKKQDWVCLLGGHPAYWISGGATHLGKKHCQRDKMGSSR